MKEKQSYKLKGVVLLHIAIDLALLLLAYLSAYVLAYFLTNDLPNPNAQRFAGDNVVLTAVFFLVITILCLYVFGASQMRWKYTTTMDIVSLLFGTGVATAFLIVFKYGFFSDEIRTSFILLYWFFSLTYLTLARYANRFVNSIRHYAQSRKIIGSKAKRVIIYGAGYLGRQVVEQLINDRDKRFLPVAIVDDDAAKHRMTISAVEVVGGRDALERAVHRYGAEEIIIAIQNISKKELKELYLACVETGLPTKITPSITDGAKELSNLSIGIRDVKMEELLGRDEFETNMALMNEFIKDKVIMVTGGAGSIGSELCRQALNFGCKHLIAFDVTENSVFFLNQEFAQKYDPSRYTLVIGSVRDKARLQSTFERYKPDVVFHAAAYKHVPMMEFSPVEAIKNNVLGTANVIDQCNASGVKKFVLISTDKAVNPANIMGASKRIAEMVVQTKAKTSKTQLAAVRFGNVLGSNGSVVGIFLDQIRKGGPVTLTHRDIKRYFMTIPEACRLVMQAGALATSGEVFVLDMGEPVYIYDLACDLIKMSGLVPERDVEIKVTGLRPGEKLFEELRFDGEACDKTLHKGIFVCKMEDIDVDVFAGQLDLLKDAIAKEDASLMARRIFEVVPSVYRDEAAGIETNPDAQDKPGKTN